MLEWESRAATSCSQNRHDRAVVLQRAVGLHAWYCPVITLPDELMIVQAEPNAVVRH